MYPLANLTALMHASVPEFTNRILSILGIEEIINSANSVSNAVGIPNDIPFLEVCDIEFRTGSNA